MARRDVEGVCRKNRTKVDLRPGASVPEKYKEKLVKTNRTGSKGGEQGREKKRRGKNKNGKGKDVRRT